MELVELATLLRLGGSPGGGGPQSIPTAFRAAYGLPSLDTTAITDSAGNTNKLANVCTLFDAITPGQCKTRVLFGKKQNDGTWLYPTIQITDDGSTGHGGLKLLNFPKGIVTMHGCFPNLPIQIGVAGGNWTMTSGVMAIGSATAAADATLTSTEADIFDSTTLNVLTYSSNAPQIGAAISGSKTSAVLGIFTANTPSAITALLDNSGGTSHTTIATIGVAGTIPAGIATQDAIAALAAQIELIRKKIDGSKSTRFDGTGTALSCFLNFAVNSDPTATQAIKLGFLAAGSETVQPAGYIDFTYTYGGGNDGTSIFDVSPPLHGAGAS